MLDQVLALAMSHVQLITACLLLTAVALELIHIGQTSRINKKLSRAARWLQRYLNAVFNESTQENETIQEEQDTRIQRSREQNPESRASVRDTKAQLEVAQLKSMQEENMRASLARKKEKRDEELLDSVLQEIFD